MLALITGSSSGIGRDMARYLSKLGYDLILTSRDIVKLEKLKEELNDKNDNKVDIIIKDLSKEKDCIDLYNEVKQKYNHIDLLINNAGFGLYGKFTETELNTELNMIDTNIKAVHILTKLFLKDMVEKDQGKILNVASIAGFMPGPLMTAYYATKSYVVRMVQGINEELRRDKSKVKISALCPGPVDTNFFKAANANFALKGISSEYVAKYAIDRVLKNKTIIVPDWKIRATRFFSKLIPDSLMAKMCYSMQKKKK